MVALTISVLPTLFKLFKMFMYVHITCLLIVFVTVIMQQSRILRDTFISTGIWYFSIFCIRQYFSFLCRCWLNVCQVFVNFVTVLFLFHVGIFDTFTYELQRNSFYKCRSLILLGIKVCSINTSIFSWGTSKCKFVRNLYFQFEDFINKCGI